VNLVQGRSTAVRLVEAVLAEREAPGAGREQLADSPRLVPDLEILVSRPGLPEIFEPSDDASVARWARALHQEAGASAHSFMRAARVHIESYRSPV
jgi:hypothetical protein